MAMAFRYREKRQIFPALQPAIRQFGDEFYTRLKSSVQADQKMRIKQAQADHFKRFETLYRNYLKETVGRHERENTLLYQEFFAEEAQSLGRIQGSRFSLNFKDLLRSFKSDEARLERFERFVISSGIKHDVLDFWGWDREANPERFTQEEV